MGFQRIGRKLPIATSATSRQASLVLLRSTAGPRQPCARGFGSAVRPSRGRCASAVHSGASGRRCSSGVGCTAAATRRRRVCRRSAPAPPRCGTPSFPGRVAAFVGNQLVDHAVTRLASTWRRWPAPGACPASATRCAIRQQPRRSAAARRAAGRASAATRWDRHPAFLAHAGFNHTGPARPTRNCQVNVLTAAFFLTNRTAAAGVEGLICRAVLGQLTPGRRSR